MKVVVKVVSRNSHGPPVSLPFPNTALQAHNSYGFVHMCEATAGRTRKRERESQTLHLCQV